MTHPYESLPEESFWRTAVAERDALEITGLWKPKIRVKRRTRIVTAGSCFAQPRKLPKFWAVLDTAAAEDGIRLLRQPEETVSQGMFTDVAYAVPDCLSKQDFEHHNAAYGAIVLARMLEFARKVPRRDALPPEAPLAKMMSGGTPDA
jgi:hypothetical protein